jgi:PadR family transcriptional regulator, regulatory protein AphA
MLKYWILGMLIKKPRSGYALRKKAFEPLRPDLSQIYRTLSEMLKGGLVKFSKVEQDKLPTQKVYFVTKKGHAELENWLRKPLLGQIERDPFLTQLWLSSTINKEDVIKNIKAYSNEAKRQIEWLEKEAKQIIARSAETSSNPIEEVYRNLVMGNDITQLKARIAWSKKAIKELNEMQITNTNRYSSKNVTARKNKLA